MVRVDDGLDDVPLAVHDGDDEGVVAGAVLERQGGAAPYQQQGQVLVAVDRRQVQRGRVRLQENSY